MSVPDCALCGKLEKAGEDPAFIHEFPSSRLYVGEHQHFPGYCVLVLKEHAREWHALPEALQARMWKDLSAATAAVEAAFRPWKINHACLGNVVGHVHWHIFPRYESETDKLENPWLRKDLFERSKPSKDEVIELVERIRRELHG